ncbi:MAG: dodecin domain-containing protein [Deltaproteobacteria bacterium]|nr:dodecin domain-containing protein [Deltaproteobacteria bacterium]
MHEIHAAWAVADAAVADASPEVLEEEPVTFEFEGSSDHTIAEAVRRALSHASTSLRTLDGAGVLVIPEIDRRANRPRFRVTLRVSAQSEPTPS